jgi:hypothetical protein
MTRSMIGSGLLLFLIVSVISGCQADTQQKPTATVTLQHGLPASLSPTATMTTTTIQPVTPTVGMATTPASNLAPTPTSIPIQDSLFSFIPEGWANIHLTTAQFGPFIYYINYASIRAELNLGNVTGASDPIDKRAYQSVIDKATQGLVMFPDIHSPNKISIFFGQWGWDIPDITQALYLPDFEILFLRGTFDFQKIQTNLASKGGLHQSRGEGYVLYQNADFYYAFVSDVMVIGTNKFSTAFIEQLYQYRQQSGQTLADNPFVKTVYNEPNRLWGIVLMTAADLSGLSPAQPLKPIPTIALKGLEYSLGPFTPVAWPHWDLIAASFRGLHGGIQLKISYHFQNLDSMASDMETIKQALKSPSFVYTGKTWSELMTLENIEVIGDMVMLTATTTYRDLLGGSIQGRDYILWFFPG